MSGSNMRASRHISLRLAGRVDSSTTVPGQSTVFTRIKTIMKWQGVVPAMTTAFDESLEVDHVFMAKHARWLIDNGCTGIVALGSLGESPTLSFDEKLAVLKTCVDAVGERVPVVAGIAALSTAEAVALAQGAAEQGCQGLMVLPPFVYKGDWLARK